MAPFASTRANAAAEAAPSAAKTNPDIAIVRIAILSAPPLKCLLSRPSIEQCALREMCDKRPLLRVQSNQMVIKERDPFIWLAPHLAGDERSYREYSERLIRDLKCYFAGNRCPQPDELTSEVLLRLVRKLDEGEPEGRDSETARRQYVFGIAKFVLMEWRRGPGAR